MSIQGNGAHSLAKLFIKAVPFPEVHVTVAYLPSVSGGEGGGAAGLQGRWGEIFWQRPVGQTCLTREAKGREGHLVRIDTVRPGNQVNCPRAACSNWVF